MNKLLALTAAALIVSPVFAQEAEPEEKPQETKLLEQNEDQNKSDLWPAFFAICEWPNSHDVIGLRLTLPFSTVEENVTGIDLGFWGHSVYFEGVQVNVIRNDVEDSLSGFQVGLYNSVGRGDMLGLQVGLWNEAMALRGFQVGLVNVLGEGEGFQVGLINRAETLYGYQVGVINILRDAELEFMPLLNIGF